MTNSLISRRDLNFILFEWLKVEDLLGSPRFAEHDRVVFDSVLDTFENVAVEHFEPHNQRNDRDEPEFVDGRVVLHDEVAPALKMLFDTGLVAATFPPELGGMMLPTVIERAGTALLMAANIGTASYSNLTLANANVIQKYGNDSQRDRYLPSLLAGRAFGTMCLSEPQAGSSLADIRTKAVPDGDGRYRLFGSKMWISGGEHELTDNIVHLVLAKIPGPDGQLPAGVRGISLFIVPRSLVDAQGAPTERNDVVLAGVNHKMGWRGTVNTLLNFGEGSHQPEGGAGAIGELVGEPGAGLKYMFHMMNESRIAVGLGAAALASTGYLHSLDYARNRPQGRPLANRDVTSSQVAIIAHPDVKRMLLAQKAYAEGALALVLYSAYLHDQIAISEDVAEQREWELLLDLLTPIAKSWSSQWGLVANDLAIQIHGGYGYTREYKVEQFYRDNRLNPIHEGTHGIQAIDLLGRKTRLEGGEALFSVLHKRVAKTIDAASNTPETAQFARSLGEYWSELLAVTRSLHAIEDADLRIANASPYLEAFGHVVVAWIWLDMASCAVAARDAAGMDRDFYEGKLAACRYFFAFELPKVRAWMSVLHPAEGIALEMQESWF